jgi:hypothetical protein
MDCEAMIEQSKLLGAMEENKSMEKKQKEIVYETATFCLS